ncbi:MAG: response regulator transcription factor [Betaproteobacteria bacterium]
MFANVTQREPPAPRRADTQEARWSLPIRVLSVGDDPLVHEGIRALLGTESDIELVGEAGSDEIESLQFTSLMPAVVLVGASLSGYGSVRTIARLHAFDPCIRVIVIASRSADVRTRRAIGAGAQGCLLSSNVRLELAKAVRAVASGHRFIDGDSAIQLMQGSRQDELKAREIQVLERVAAGKANKEIAYELSTTEGTVKNYIKRILYKLHASDRTHAVVIGIARGIIEIGALPD